MIQTADSKKKKEKKKKEAALTPFLLF